MKPRKCPFCGGKHDYTEYNEIMNKWVLNHYCHRPNNIEMMSVFIVGETEEDVLKAWGYEDEHE